MNADELKKGAEESGGEKEITEDEAWKEAGEILVEQGVAEKPPEGTTEKKADEKKDEGQDAAPGGGEEGETKGKDGDGKPAGEGEEEYRSPDAISKALKDTKAHLTKVSQEAADLRKKLADFEKGKATERQVSDAEKAVKDAKDALEKNLGALKEAKGKILEDYPELQALIDPLIETVETFKGVKDEVDGLKKTTAKTAEEDLREKQLQHFKTEVLPKVEKTHADADSILKSENYWKWVEDQSPGMKYMAEKSPDPGDIIHAMTEFKKSGLYTEAKKIAEKDDASRKKKIENATGVLRGGASDGPKVQKKDEEKSYDDHWDDAGKLLREKGVSSGAA